MVMAIRNCYTCRYGKDCELNIHMDSEQKAIKDQCDSWEYPYDFTLRECPFCGNPAEIIDAEPFEWNPNIPVKAIRCSNKWGCPGNQIKIRFSEDSKSSEIAARNNWNKRKRKNKLTWRKGEAE